MHIYYMGGGWGSVSEKQFLFCLKPVSWVLGRSRSQNKTGPKPAPGRPLTPSDGCASPRLSDARRRGGAQKNQIGGGRSFEHHMPILRRDKALMLETDLPQEREDTDPLELACGAAAP